MYVTSDGDVFPETIEEWIEIHGEPPLEEMEVS